MSQFTLKITDAYSKDVRLVFTSGKSLRDMLVSSSFGTQDCPKTIYKMTETKGRGRPPECRACDARIPSGRCMDKRVVYSMFCSLCKAEYVGETESCLRDRIRHGEYTLHLHTSMHSIKNHQSQVQQSWLVCPAM